MTIVIAEEPMTAIVEYARVPIVFTVERVLDVIERDGGVRPFELRERRLEVPYEKDYDAIAGEGPLQWARHFDLSRRDLAALWDIRVAPDARRKGIGSALFQNVEAWGRLHGCRQLKVETQNTNVRACQFYERRGCVLRAINYAVYPELPEEIQMLWYKDMPN